MELTELNQSFDIILDYIKDEIGNIKINIDDPSLYTVVYMYELYVTIEELQLNADHVITYNTYDTIVELITELCRQVKEDTLLSNIVDITKTFKRSVYIQLSEDTDANVFTNMDILDYTVSNSVI